MTGLETAARLELPRKRFALMMLGDVRACLARLPDASVDCVVTSPPYWSKRDYGIPPSVWGGTPGCAHEWGDEIILRKKGNAGAPSNGLTSGGAAQAEAAPGKLSLGRFCSRCRAWEGQLGLEPRPQLYVDHLTAVLRETKRVLKDAGTLWLNMGDTYNTPVNNWATAPDRPRDGEKGRKMRAAYVSIYDESLPAKCLAGIPERVMLSLLGEGWILRNKVVWAKQNHMPESVKDRLSMAWEAVYLFSKRGDYWFDLHAIRVPHVLDFGSGRPAKGRSRKHDSVAGQQPQTIAKHSGYFGPNGELLVDPAGANPSDVWEMPTAKRGWASSQDYCFKMGYDHHVPEFHRKRDITTPTDFWKMTMQPSEEDHYAVFPEKLVERPVKAACPGEVCASCGRGRERILQKPDMRFRPTRKTDRADGEHPNTNWDGSLRSAGQAYQDWRDRNPDRTVGWTDCGCGGPFAPGVVLDPFGGSGTVAKVALGLGRSTIYVDVKPGYLEIAKRRVDFGHPTVDGSIEWLEAAA